MSKPTILCMFSGGVDSAGVLHELQTNEKYQSFSLIVHHIHIWNRENRALAELDAVKKILNYYKRQGKSQFLFTQSIFDTRGFAPLQSMRFPMDMDVCAFTASQICAARPDVQYVAMGRTKTDVESGGENFKLRMQRAQAIFKSSLSLENHRPAEYIFPVVDYTKKEIWNFLPEEVSQSTWWCRRPNYEHEVSKSCGSCTTCLEMAQIIG
ncbi:PP-loop family protein [Reichenbachiella faecimaris]|uniref:PP-loop family protein n=1 Tax=Reichenbachiella faecimaris TaxID=692418 RepID=A0A1W2G9Q3_REIFA|nr:ATP-binding protein [Reichenbachiella faecimaris]SMD33088.1 PP-loop family protein [Reichenbachiella faecimaris]